jgi:hypothetical protein
MPKLVFAVPPNDISFPRGLVGPVAFCINAMGQPQQINDPNMALGYMVATDTYPITGEAPNSALWICSGVRPTAAQVEANASSVAFKTAYLSQKLIEFRPLSYNLRTDVTTKQVIITYFRDTVAPASLTGTATWWVAGDYYSSGISPIYVGDVSNLAGSGEIKLVSTTITTGVSYLLSPFTFCVSSSVVLS